METNLNTSHIPFGYKFTYSVKSFNKNPVLASNNLGYCSSLSFIFSREKHHLKQRQNKATFTAKPRTQQLTTTHKTENTKNIYGMLLC